VTRHQQAVMIQIQQLVKELESEGCQFAYRDGFMRVKDDNGDWAVLEWDGLEQDWEWSKALL